MDDRIRTGDRLDHNQELYQLSYVHRAGLNLAVQGCFQDLREVEGRGLVAVLDLGATAEVEIFPIGRKCQSSDLRGRIGWGR